MPPCIRIASHVEVVLFVELACLMCHDSYV